MRNACARVGYPLSQRAARSRLVVGLITLAFTPTVVLAQGGNADPAVETLLNYPYAVGDTAAFNVEGQSVQVVRLPLSYTLRSLDKHPWGVKLRFPVSVGLHEFSASDALGGELRERLGTLSAMAGAEFLVPVSERWMLRPFAEVGAGKDLEGGATAWIYSAGLRTVMEDPREKLLLRLGVGLDYDGATLTSGAASNGYTTLETGLDFRFPMKRSIGGRGSDWSLFAIRRRFLSALTFDQLNDEPIELRNQNELGFTLGVDRPWSLWLLRVDRVGLGFRFGDRLSSVRILFGVPF